MNKLINKIFKLKHAVDYLPIVSKLVIILGFVISLVNEIDDQGWRTIISFVVIVYFLYDVAKTHLQMLDSNSDLSKFEQ